MTEGVTKVSGERDVSMPQKPHFPSRHDRTVKLYTHALRKAVLTSAIQLQYNSNTWIFACIAVVLHICGFPQYNSAIQVFYNLQKTCRLLAAVVKTCIAVVLRLCGLLQYNKIFVLFYCSCIVVVLHLCGPLKGLLISSWIYWFLWNFRETSRKALNKK